MIFPFDIHIGNGILHIHLVTDVVSAYIGYRYYKYLRSRQGDHLSDEKRLSIIVAAALGALIGSRLLAFLEHIQTVSHFSLAYILSNKTIAGGIMGGVIGVEIVKKYHRIRGGTGDLLVLPLILAIVIGRIGCFLTGVSDGTVGNVSNLPWAFDQGDGLMRHPTSLYEILFLLACFFIFRTMLVRKHVEGVVFKVFVFSYLIFRVLVEFIKPVDPVFFGLSFIQTASLIFCLYYVGVFWNMRAHRLGGGKNV